MSGFEVTVLGVGDTFTDRHHPTCFLLEHDGFRLAIDCPDSYRRVLADASRHGATGGAEGRAPLDLDSIDHVLITHVHGDHMNGLEGVAFYKHFVQRRPVQLVTTPEVREVLWEQRLRAPMEQLWDGQAFRQLGPTDYFADHPLDWNAAIEVGPFRIHARRTHHHVPTSALRVEAGGRTWAYSADTAFDPSLIAFLAEADLIFHETNLGPAHTPYAELAGLPAELRARMRLCHYPDRLLNAGERELAIVPLHEGEVLGV
jgi:ribonuclease BN (tRNA processing enzyme)